MSTTTPPLEIALPEIAFGSVWLVGAGNGKPEHLSPLAVNALATADAVIHDQGIANEILDLVKPPRYREGAAPGRAIERSVKLAQEGWRVVHLVDGNAMDRAVECAIRFAEHDIPFHIAPHDGERGIGEAPVGLLVCKPVPVGLAEASTLVMLVTAAQSQTPTDHARRQPPLSFSLSGLAG